MNKRKILESAQKHLQKGALDKALEDYQTLLKADPKDSNIRLKVGDLHLKLGRNKDAIDAYLRVAQQFSAEGFDAKAVALYKQITKLDDKRYEVHAQLGELYERMGLASEAMRSTQLAADGAHRAGDKDQALSLLRRMAALDPSNTTSRLKVADLLRAEGRNDDALAEYDEVIRELERQQNVEEQVKVLERALEVGPARAQTLRALASAATKGGQYEKAERAARMLVDATPDDVEALEMLGVALEKAGRIDEASDVFRSLAERFRARGDEDRARALVQRYGAPQSFGDADSSPPVLEDEASGLTLEPAFDESLGLVPLESDDASSDLELGDAQLEDLTPAGRAGEAAVPDAEIDVEIGTGSFAEAPAAFDDEPSETTGETDGSADLEQLLAEASVFARYGKHERAIDTLRAALRLEPGSALALEKLGESLAAIGNRAHASSALQRAGAAYVAGGDAEGVLRVRSLLEPLDRKAAAALVVPEAAAPEPVAGSDTGTDSDGGSAEDDIDVIVDSDLAIEREPSPEDHAAEEAAVAQDFSGIEIDVSGDLADEPAADVPGDGTEVRAEAEQDFSFGTRQESAPRGPATAEHPAPGAAADADFEEAEFYREQGLLDEARALYERVLAAVPGHQGARLRLGDLAKAAKAAKPAAPPAVTPPAAPRLVEPPSDPPDVGGPRSAPPASEVELDFSEESDASPPAPEDAELTARQIEDAPVDFEPPEPAEQRAPPQRPLEIGALGGDEFDLAAELSGAFDGAGGSSATLAAAENEAFEEVFAAFKEGVKREVGAGDYEAHYDLGIAYKEMGLFDDAIGEFHVALGDSSRRIACLHLMGMCALDLGRVADAVAHLSEALAGEALPADQEAALRVDLGRAHSAGGDRARARSCFEAARRLVPDFAGLDDLLAQLDREPAAAGASAAEEALESFDDLLGSPEPREAAAAPRYESFDDLVGDDDGARARAREEPPASRATRPPPEAAEDPPRPAEPPPRQELKKPRAGGAPRPKKKISFV